MRKMRRIVVFLVLMCFGTASAQEPTAAPLDAYSLTVDGIERTYSVYMPDAAAGEALPVVVALHGRPGSGAGMARMSGLSAVAEEEGFIAVYPDGLNGEWKYFGGILDDESLNTPDDVAFLKALVDDLTARFEIDAERVYLIGFSNGGFMTYRMACSEAPNPFAGFGIAAALIYPDMELPCLAAPVRPMVIEHGTADLGVAWDGIQHQPVRGLQVTSRNTLQSVSFFAARNGCSTFGADREDFPSTDGVTSVSRFDFAECTTGQPIRFFAIIDGGHTWPGMDEIPAEVAGPVNMDINLGREMWQFFEEAASEDVPSDE
jgi:polyhydroxybutyrate depolymerase